ncbi:alpha/beta hydrolase-fold protein [Paenibacillus sedimenti]|uniref:Esterase n=1 Tax=Paenibacillus sedimenti TaxID=2770274 RepID=A0A926QN70_9BACL|nr:prolyl oligopeptidase family serine peptidase [Paenibacillus sedimenti]MBD0384673.1 hypothetical protein [Paenibacillus sedimenti]
MTTRLMDSVESSYNIDNNRIYGTGQSMGCMTVMLLAAEHPDLFTAEMFVDGQWDVNKLASLAGQKFFYFAAEGDDKAYAGQTDLLPVLQKDGAKVSTATWDATWSADQFTSAVKSELAKETVFIS